MKILKYLDTINRGGAEMQVLDICRNAARHGLEFTIATRGGALEPDLAAAGIELIKLRRRLPFDPDLALKLRRIVKTRGIDLVHSDQPVEGLHLYAATRGLSRTRSVPNLMTYHGFISDERNRLIAKFLSPRVSQNIIVSNALRDWLAESRGLRFGANSCVIYNGVDTQRLQPAGGSLRAELGLGSSARLIGMIGNFYRDERKDQLTVVRALPELFKRHREVHCIFAGSVEAGAEHKAAECRRIAEQAGIEDRVHFLGARTDVPDILSELSVFAFSSLHEGLPIAAAEAMLAGVPLVVSDIEPLMEATENGRFAEVFRVRDSDELRQRLDALLTDENARRTLADRARTFALERYTIDAHLDALSRLYGSLLKK